jgi:hypothetical protein
VGCNPLHHKLRYCESYDTVRGSMFDELKQLNVQAPVPTHDLCGLKMFNVQKICINLFIGNHIQI